MKSDNFEISDDNEKDENEKSENIAALSKNIVSKISEFNWVADSDVFSHMTDQLWLFSDSLVCTKKMHHQSWRKKIVCQSLSHSSHARSSWKLSQAVFCSSCF